MRAMRAHGEGRITLRTHHVPALSLPTVDERLIRTTRERLRVSRTAFARRLGVTPRTLERWEEGRSTPNDQAAALTCWSGSILTRCRAWGRSRQPGRSEGRLASPKCLQNRGRFRGLARIQEHSRSARNCRGIKPLNQNSRAPSLVKKTRF